MLFVIPVAENAEGITKCHTIETNSDCARTNRKYLREYALKMGVKKYEIKRFFKMMRFDKEALSGSSESKAPVRRAR